MKDHLSRVGWLAGVVVVAGILLLAAGIEIPPWAARDPSSGGRLASLVTCVLPPNAASPPPAPSGASETVPPDCQDPAPHRAVWIAC